MIRELLAALDNRELTACLPLTSSIYGAINENTLGDCVQGTFVCVNDADSPYARLVLSCGSAELLRTTCFAVLDHLLSKLATE
jgi:hypothetical protein